LWLAHAGYAAEVRFPGRVRRGRVPLGSVRERLDHAKVFGLVAFGAVDAVMRGLELAGRSSWWNRWPGEDGSLRERDYGPATLLASQTCQGCRLWRPFYHVGRQWWRGDRPKVFTSRSCPCDCCLSASVIFDSRSLWTDRLVRGMFSVSCIPARHALARSGHDIRERKGPLAGLVRLVIGAGRARETRCRLSRFDRPG
jgi:hypothetical protein